MSKLNGSDQHLPELSSETVKISLMTDEVSSDLETALELATDWGVDGVELRGVGDGRYPEVPDLDRVRVPELLERWGLPVSAISPGLFKIPLPARELDDIRMLRWADAAAFRRKQQLEQLARDHLERLLPLSIEAARTVGAQTLICFSFERGDNALSSRAPDWIIDVLRDAAASVGQAKLVLALEPENGCWGDVGSRTADIVQRVDNPAFGINWDPANVFQAGEDRPYPDGYRAVRGLVRHVHYKQASDLPSGKRGFTSRGTVDWRGQLDELMADGYKGWITVEPHVTPKVMAARRALEELKTLLGR